MVEAVRRTAKGITVPLAVGGGINSIQVIEDLLDAGASKISINTAAVENENIVYEGAKRFGSQCIVVAIDAKRRYESRKDRVIVDTPEGSCWFEVHIYGGTGGKPTGIDAIKWAVRAAELGAGELLVTSMDRDGTKDGYDLELTRSISERVKIPVIASGGAGKPEHFLEAFTIGRADAALAASIFHFREYPVPVVKKFLAERGVPVRLED